MDYMLSFPYGHSGIVRVVLIQNLRQWTNVFLQTYGTPKSTKLPPSEHGRSLGRSTAQQLSFCWLKPGDTIPPTAYATKRPEGAQKPGLKSLL